MDLDTQEILSLRPDAADWMDEVLAACRERWGAKVWKAGQHRARWSTGCGARWGRHPERGCRPHRAPSELGGVEYGAEQGCPVLICEVRIPKGLDRWDERGGRCRGAPLGKVIGEEIGGDRADDR